MKRSSESFDIPPTTKQRSESGSSELEDETEVKQQFCLAISVIENGNLITYYANNMQDYFPENIIEELKFNYMTKRPFLYECVIMNFLGIYLFKEMYEKIATSVDVNIQFKGEERRLGDIVTLDNWNTWGRGKAPEDFDGALKIFYFAVNK